MNNENFNTPILLIVWRRPEKTLRVIEKIKQINAKILYVACDGYKEKDFHTINKVEETRKIINDSINWDCKIKKLFSDHNQGCKNGVSNAINWFFQNEREGIILEDDCLPHLDFFYFCEKMLKKYRTDERIWSITGQNIQNGIWHGDSSYYFSKYSHCWGWASWKRCWENYDKNIKSWPNYKKLDLLSNFFEKKRAQKYWVKIFDNIYYNNSPDTWDYQWTYACLINSGLTVIPNKNLVENIGFDIEATHTKTEVFNTKILNFSRHTSGIFPIKHPKNVYQFKKADEFTEKICYSGYPFYTIKGLRRLIQKIFYKFSILKILFKINLKNTF